MLNKLDSTNSNTRTITTTKKKKKTRSRIQNRIPLDIGSDLRNSVESTISTIKPGYAHQELPNGAFEIDPDGTILHFRPYDANGISIDEMEGLNLFDDVIRSSSERDAKYFETCIQRGQIYKTSRHLLHGRDLSLILLYHSSTDTYWGFLGPS